MSRLALALIVLALIVATPAYAPPAAIATFYEREIFHSSLGNFRGATETWQGEILLKRQRKIIGASTTACIRVSLPIRHCAATYALPQGVVEAQGIIGSLRVYSLAITGGTGVYLGASGWVKTFSVANGPRISELTFHLLTG